MTRWLLALLGPVVLLLVLLAAVLGVLLRPAQKINGVSSVATRWVRCFTGSDILRTLHHSP